MNNSVQYFEIQADNPERALKFYQDLFGWKFSSQAGAPVPYWQIQTPGINGGLLQRPAPTPPMSGTNAFTCSVQVEDFDATSQAIQASGGSIALPKFPIPGRCWQGYFLDTEGNTFGLFQVDEKAGLA